jgi:hypothetical protein
VNKHLWNVFPSKPDLENPTKRQNFEEIEDLCLDLSTSAMEMELATVGLIMKTGPGWVFARVGGVVGGRLDSL